MALPPALAEVRSALALPANREAGPDTPRERGLHLAALAGRFVELSGQGASATLSFAFRLVLEAQERQANAAWITVEPAPTPEPAARRARPRRRAPVPFYAPDVAESGVDLGALPIVLAPSALHAGRAASQLLRSGAFALVVLDLVPAARAPDGAELPLPVQSRLVGLAQRHGAALVALTDKPRDAPSLGSLVSLHATTSRHRLPPDDDDRDGRDPGHPLFEVRVEVDKDKRHGPGWAQAEVFRGPAGLR